MGTSIRMTAYRDMNLTTDEQWKKFKDWWMENYEEAEEDVTYVSSGIVYTSYSSAKLEKQLQEIMPELAGSGIQISLWYEERDPDEEVTL